MAHKKTSHPISQVRIIGGKFKRHQIGFVDGDGLRPTPDRLRETLFNWLMADILDARVLDMCAGSGVLGFEALSRGASFVSFIEPNPKQLEQLKHSADKLKLNAKQVQFISDHAQNAFGALGTPFDIIFIDPPYAKNLWHSLLWGVSHHQLYHDDTLIYIESDRALDDVLAHFQSQTLKSTKVGQVYASIIRLSK